MMTIIQNGVQTTVNYTVENNLVPAINELQCIMKEMMYFGGLSRNDSSGYSNHYNRNINTILKDYYLYPGLFENGHISIFDENDNALGHSDLFGTYSGTDTARGTININESKLYNYNNIIRTKIVIDFPTHAANGNIKKIRLYSKPVYDRRVNNIGDTIRNNKIGTMFSSSSTISDINNAVFCTSFDKNNNAIIIDSANKIICYNNKVYNYTGTPEKIFNLLNKFYIFSSHDTTNKKFILKNISFDDTSGNAIINDTDTLQLPYVFTSSSYPISTILNIVEIDSVIYSIYRDSNYASVYITKYNSDYTVNSNNNVQTGLSITKPIPIFTYLVNDDKCMYFYDYDNRSFVKIDIVNMTASKITDTIFNAANNSFAYYNCDITQIDNNLKLSGTNYWFGVRNENCSPMSPFMIVKKDTVKVPLTITLDTPLTKTSDQTLKLILDINIQ